MVSVAFAINAYLAYLVLTSNSPQLTSSISSLYIVHLAFQSSWSLFSISYFSRKVIDDFYGNNFLMMEVCDFSIKKLKALK